MNYSTLIHVENIAAHTRLWAERIAHKEYFDDELNGLCARASARLFKHLKFSQYNPQLVYSTNRKHAHVWVKLMDHIVDVTASQFGHRNICIIPCRRSRPWYWRETTIYTSIDAIQKFQRSEQWPRNQRVKRKELHEEYPTTQGAPTA